MLLFDVEKKRVYIATSFFAHACLFLLLDVDICHSARQILLEDKGAYSFQYVDSESACLRRLLSLRMLCLCPER